MTRHSLIQFKNLLNPTLTHALRNNAPFVPYSHNVHRTSYRVSRSRCASSSSRDTSGQCRGWVRRVLPRDSDAVFASCLGRYQKCLMTFSNKWLFRTMQKKSDFQIPFRNLFNDCWRQKAKNAIIEATIEVWESLDERFFLSLAASTPRRVKAIFKARGGYTRH
jgi:hypothetical protein